ncbi:MAG: recombinase family protein [Ruminococcaceae bacterium]|nr:recombinase family protein [Oscillospiraceae bacterium]
MKKAALYVRVSTEGQAEEGYSIEAQKKMLEAWCVSKEIENYEFYIDPGYSGSNLDRPAVSAMLADCTAGVLSHVVVYKLDRLSRSQKDTLFIIEDVLNKHGVDFVSLSENMDTSTPIGRAMLGIISAFAQLERETIKIRTRMGMRERVKNGLWMGGGKIPFGYDYDGNKGILVPNEDAETVREMYRLFLSGYSPNTIAKILGLKYEKLAVQILKRKTNIGVISYKGDEYPGQHEAIVDEATYYAAMEEFEKRGRGILADSPHLLSGLIFCGECSARMRYQKWGKKGYKLVCYSQQKSKPYLVHDPNCRAERVWAEDVEAEVLEDIFSMGVEKEKKKTQKVRQKESIALEKKLKRLYSLYGDGNSALEDVIHECEEKLRKAKKREEEENKQDAERLKREEAMERIKSVADVWDSLTADEKRALVRSVVDRICIFGDKINIYYRF